MVKIKSAKLKITKDPANSNYYNVKIVTVIEFKKNPDYISIVCDMMGDDGSWSDYDYLFKLGSETVYINSDTTRTFTFTKRVKSSDLVEDVIGTDEVFCWVKTFNGYSHEEGYKFSNVIKKKF